MMIMMMPGEEAEAEAERGHPNQRHTERREKREKRGRYDEAGKEGRDVQRETRVIEDGRERENMTAATEREREREKTLTRSLMAR